MEIFKALFKKLGLALGARALSFALWKLGLPRGALLMAFLGRFLITEGASEIGIGPQMMATGSADSGNSSSGWTSILGSGSSGGNSGWTSILGQGDGFTSQLPCLRIRGLD